MNRKKTILFVHYGEDWIRGSERCLIDLICHIDRSEFLVLVWCNSKVLYDELTRLNITSILTRFSILLGWGKPFFDIKNFIRLIGNGINLINEYHVDLVHSNSGAPNQWMALACRYKNIPLLTQLHAPYLFRDRLSLGLHNNTHLVGVSRAVTQAFRSDGRDDSTMSVIYNGIDIEHLLATNVENKGEYNVFNRLKMDIPPIIKLATIGSLIHRKGIDLCIRAVADLAEQGVQCSLTVIGEGDERSNLEFLSRKLGVMQNVIFVGEHRNPIAILKKDIDIYIACPRDEAFGLTLAEAGLAKLPVIASRVGGIPEVVVHNKSGILIEPNNHQALSSALLTLIKNPKRRKSLGENGFKRTIKKFGIHRNHLEFEELYKRLTAENRTCILPRHGLRNAIFNRFVASVYKSRYKIFYKAFCKRFHKVIYSPIHNPIHSRSHKNIRDTTQKAVEESTQKTTQKARFYSSLGRYQYD